MGKKIMIVEDDPQIFDYLETLFNDNGYETCSATSGVDAIKMVKENNPDLITLDLIMPGSWGNILYKKVQKDDHLRDIPIIIISGAEELLPMGDISKAVVLKLDKAVAFFKKPFDKEELLKVVRDILGE